jgi:hypothetical protein
MEELNMAPEQNQDGYMSKHQKNFDELMLHLARDLKQYSGPDLVKGLELWVIMFNIRRS